MNRWYKKGMKKIMTIDINKGKGKYSVKDIMSFLLMQVEQKGVRISREKMTYLLFFAQGFYVYLNNTPLFSEEFQLKRNTIKLCGLNQIWLDLNLNLVQANSKNLKMEDQIFLMKVLNCIVHIEDDQLSRFVSNGTACRGAAELGEGSYLLKKEIGLDARRLDQYASSRKYH